MFIKTPEHIAAVRALYPNSGLIHGDDVFDNDGNKITYDQNAIQEYIDSRAYIAKRQREYPPITDYLDGVVKGDQVQIQKYIDDCLAVKKKYPK